jgi:dihydropteroate synthase
VTPDSFSDGGAFLSPASALQQARRVAAEGADIIDVGAESTRPGSGPVAPADQISRLRDVLDQVAGLGVPVSIDTGHAAVAKFALEAGASIINDISAGLDDPQMFALARQAGAAMVLMHRQGPPRTMQDGPRYADVVAQVRDFLRDRLEAARSAGVDAGRLIVDPGIGFGKTTGHNLALLAGLGKLAELGVPVLVGVSRKRFVGEITRRDQPADRLFGTLGAVLACWARGATIFRVHDVAAAREALAVAWAIDCAGPEPAAAGPGPRGG